MSNIFKNRATPLVLLSTLGIIVLWVVAVQFDVFGRWRLHANVDDLVNNRENLESAVGYLQDSPRGQTIEAITAALESEVGTPQGKVYALQMLTNFKEDRTVARALSSTNLTTQRAAAYLRQGLATKREEVATIALAWLRDKESDDRQLAAMVLRTTNWTEATPDLLAVIKEEGHNKDSARLVRHALGALSVFKQEGLVPYVLPLAKDPNVDVSVRTTAFQLLTRLDDAPRDELRTLLIATAADPDANDDLRHMALGQLGNKTNANEEAWKTCLDVLYDENESNEILQRSALRALATSYPLDRFTTVLLDRRVYAHRYFGIRTDVAAAIGNLRVESRLALDVLTKLVGDDDDLDFLDNVVRQAWIAWWQITGMVYGVAKGDEEKFRSVPKPRTNEEFIRSYLLSISSGNRGQFTEEQATALDAFTLTKDDSQLRSLDPDKYKQIKSEKRELAKRIQQTYEGKIDFFAAKWD
jgi:hypothetical protein